MQSAAYWPERNSTRGPATDRWSHDDPAAAACDVIELPLQKLLAMASCIDHGGAELEPAAAVLFVWLTATNR